MVVNPFNINSAIGSSATGRSSTAVSDTTFEQQLSSALAESLGKLGVKPGEINITVRNEGGTLNGRQITVSYRIDDSTQPATTLPVKQQNWAPYDGPRDSRDSPPLGGGDTSVSGAPLIKASKEAASNQYGYTGPAARNPYFTTPSNPLRPGYVLGFQNWFANTSIVGGASGPVAANKTFYATDEGAQEALRLVEELLPGAKITNEIWAGGIFSASNPTFNIETEDGRKFNAGGILASYYNQGYGVTAYSDQMLKRVLGLAT